MYTLTGNNSFIRSSDGTIIPFDPKNSNYLDAIQLLLGLALISVDSNNVITTFNPDGSNLIAAPQPTLTDLRNAAKAAIDEAAGRARARYITVAPGQDATYIAKAMDADKYKAAAYSPADGTGYLWVIAEKTAMGGTTTARQAADSIIAQRDQWYQLGSSLEQIRIGGKLDIDTRLKDTTIAASRDATVALLNGI